MCLLFIYINPGAGPGEYKVIIANNRDEYYHRPSKPAHFWSGMRNVIGGTDEEKGREGGTWLAMNQNGKVACLLNILQPRDEIHPDKKGRGFLVNDYVQGKQSPVEYLQNLRNVSSEYNGFLLATMDTFLSNPSVSFYTNKSELEPESLSPGFHVFGNSPPVKPWEKVIQGKKLFKEVVNKSSKTIDHETLKEDLLLLLKNPTAYPLDDQMRRQGMGLPESVIAKKNALFYSIPEYNYGTRSHTIILIDGANNAEYVESCMEEPINIKGNVKWVQTSEAFALGCKTPVNDNDVC